MSIADLKRQWLHLDVMSDKRGKVALLRSLKVDSPEMGALLEFIMSIHFTDKHEEGQWLPRTEARV